MSSIQINDLPAEANEAKSLAVAEANRVMGGATLKAEAKPKQEYLKYELENVLISSYSIGSGG